MLKFSTEELKQRFSGSYLGVLWAFINPLITITIFYFVFHIGFKSAPAENVPFVLWLMAGMFPWMFFSESVMSACGSILEKPYLVKKIVFEVSILPPVKILTSLYIHSFFLLVMFIMFLLNGISPDIHFLQVFYYIFCLISLALGLGWLTSSIVIFIRDISQIVGLFIQFGFWLTPIFWSHKIMPEKFQFFIKLNPLFYIIEGYRDSLVNKVWFWEKPQETLYFWGFTLSVLFMGTYLFRRLKPHFSDII